MIGEQFTKKLWRKLWRKLWKNYGEKGHRNGHRKSKKILKAITADPSITTDELSRIVGISSRKIKENIAKLKTKNLLKRIGPAKGGYWEIPEK